MKKRAKRTVPKLKRELGLFSATAVGIAIIVGAGIYALIGKAAGIAGEGVWLSLAIAAVVALLTGLSYAELSSMFPKAGSSFVYVKKAFRSDFLGFIAGWMILFELLAGGAAVALALAGYALSLAPVNIAAAAVISIIAFSALNLAGIKESVFVNNVFCVLEVAGLLAIIAIGFALGPRGVSLAVPDFGGALAGAALIFFAYIGFEAIAMEAEETRFAKRTIPKAILLSIAVCAVLYIATGFALLKLLPAVSLGASNAPASEALSAAVGNVAWVIALIAVASCANTILMCLVTASRLLYGIAREGSFPKLFSTVSARFGTPHWSVAAACAVTLLFLIVGGLRETAEVTNFGALSAFLLVNLSVVMLRVRQPGLKREFRIPFAFNNVLVLPLLGALSCFLLLLQFSFYTWAISAAVIVSGVSAWILFKGR
jgi:APA family basic amino acid/polyamine antiporter